MIQSIRIQNFKSIENQVFDFKPLTILTGTNSSGKSSVIQAILFYVCENNNHILLSAYLQSLGTPNDLLYINAKTKKCSILPIINGKKLLPLEMVFKEKSKERNDEVLKNVKLSPIFEQDIYYMSANRIGQESLSQLQDDIKCGINGEYILGFYESYKNTRLNNDKLISKDADSEALNAQVSFWLYKILDSNLMLTTQIVGNTKVKVTYQNFDLANGMEMSPFNLGAGISYLTKILILGLSLKEGDILIVENPEVHLHPKAISKFAEFFVFLANGGIQVILETHSEHIINKMRYSVFGRKISKDDIQIYYRERFDMPFESIQINERGKYVNKNGEIIEFPSGFFDSDLRDLLEMM